MRTPPSHNSSEGTIFALAGCMVAVAGVVWLWGGVAGTLFGRGWPHVRLVQLLGVVARLPAHPFNPAAAWPPSVRSKLPAVGYFYLVLTMIGTALALTGWLTKRAIDARRNRVSLAALPPQFVAEASPPRLPLSSTPLVEVEEIVSRSAARGVPLVCVYGQRSSTDHAHAVLCIYRCREEPVRGDDPQPPPQGASDGA